MADAEIWSSVDRQSMVWRKCLRCIKSHVGRSHLLLNSSSSCLITWQRVSSHTNFWSQISSTFSMQMFTFLETYLYSAASKIQRQRAADVCHTTRPTAAHWTPATPVAKPQKSYLQSMAWKSPIWCRGVTRPSWNRNLTVVEGLWCRNDRGSHIVGGYLPLVGSSKANWS